MKHIEVELLEAVEFVTHSKVYTYAEGVQTIPSDLAKLMFKLGKARPVVPVKTVPISKQGRF